MFTRKAVFSSIGRAHRDGDGCGDGADGHRALAGSRRLGARQKSVVCFRDPRDHRFQLPWQDLSRQRRRRRRRSSRVCRALSAPAWRLRLPRTGALITTIMTPMMVLSMAGRPITVPARLLRWRLWQLRIVFRIRRPAHWQLVVASSRSLHPRVSQPVTMFSATICRPCARMAGRITYAVRWPLTRWPRFGLAWGNE